MSSGMSEAEIRDLIMRAVLAASGFRPPVDPFVGAEELQSEWKRADSSGMDGGGTTTTAPGCYSIESTDDGAITFANPYFMVGGNLYTGPGSISIDSSCVVALKISANSSYSCRLERYGSVEALREAQQDLGFYILPLYQFAVTEDDEGNKSVSVVCDFRNIPSAAMGEF